MFQNNLLMGAASAGVSLVSVENSALFNKANTEYLTLTFGTSTEIKKNTVSFWVYFGLQGIDRRVIDSSVSAGDQQFIRIDINDKLEIRRIGGTAFQLISNNLFRDIGWAHFIVQQDTPQSTAADRVTAWVSSGNGTGYEEITWGTSSYPNQNDDAILNQATVTTISGYTVTHTTDLFDGYLSEFVFIDGLALDPSSFGEASTDGLYWTPKSSAEIKALTFGTNGFYLDNTTNAQTDASGNGNNFTNNNSVVTITHTPTNSYATLNPLQEVWGAAVTLSNGNLTGTGAGAVSSNNIVSTLPVTAGKWIFASLPDALQAMDASLFVCNETSYALKADNVETNTNNWGAVLKGTTSFDRIEQGTTTTHTPSPNIAVGDYALMAVDIDNLKVWSGWHDVSTGTSYWADTSTGFTGDPAAGTGGMTLDGTVFHLGGWFYPGRGGTLDFGQGSLLSNVTIPTGFEFLNTTNIAAATTRTQSDPYEHWNNILYTGNGTAIGSGGNAITGAGFAPDFAWIKGRSGATEHALTDIIRGVTKELSCNDEGVEETVAEGLTAFGSDGFTVGSNGSYNTSSATYVAWCAKLGGTASTNEAGTIDSSVSVNQTLGMSVGTYTGNGTAGATVGHGLNVTPSLIITKRLNSAGNWFVGHTDVGWTKYMVLQLGNAAAAATTVWNNTAPTSTVFSIGTSADINASGSTYVFYAFAPSEYISIGSYEGNSNANGTFIPTLNSLGIPIQPIWWLHKCADTGLQWYILDSAQQTYNVLGSQVLSPNTTEATPSADAIYREADFVTGGVKIRVAGDQINNSNTHIYMAIGTPIIDVDGRIIAGR